jgi:outer membrane protein
MSLRGTMHLFGICIFEQQEKAMVSRRDQAGRGQAGRQLCAAAAILLACAAGISSGYAQQVPGAGASAPDKAASELPSAPTVVLTEPVNLRPSLRDFSKPAGRFLGNPFKMYLPTSIDKASFSNSVRLTDLVKDGKIYLSLSDALALALENNFDIAIARYDLDIADTDLLRTRTGLAPCVGVPSGLITGTLGGSASILTTGGGPGGTTVGSGGAGSGSSAGLTLTTAGAGPTAGVAGPSVTAPSSSIAPRRHPPTSSSPAPGRIPSTYNFSFTQGFTPGTALAVAWNNSRNATTSNGLASYST